MNEKIECNLLEEFINQVLCFLTKNSIDLIFLKSKRINLIKQHTEKLNITGDFSFSNINSVWRQHFHKNAGIEIESLCTHCDRLFIVNRSADAKNASCASHTYYNVQDLVTASQCFTLQIKAVTFDAAKDRVIVFLNRKIGLEKIIKLTLLNENANQSRVTQELSVPKCKLIKVTRSDISNKENPSVIDHRLQLLESVIKNLLRVSSEYKLYDDDNEEDNYSDTDTNSTPNHDNVMYFSTVTSIHLTTKSSMTLNSNVRKVLSGIVTEPKSNNKLATMTANEYIR